MQQHHASPDHLPDDTGHPSASPDELTLAIVGAAAIVAVLFLIIALKAAAR